MLMVYIAQVFSDCKLSLKKIDAIAVSSGPGSYTGLRIGAATAKGLCYAIDKPLIAIDSLQAYSIGMETRNSDGDILYCPTVDARRNEIYFGLFDKKGQELIKSQNIMISEQIPFTIPANKRILVGGSGALKCRELWKTDQLLFEDNLYYSASNMNILSLRKTSVRDFTLLATFSPNYVKPVYITH